MHFSQAWWNQGVITAIEEAPTQKLSAGQH